MPRSFSVSIFALLCCSAQQNATQPPRGQQQQDTSPVAAKKPGRVEGTVINSVTGSPVKKASVFLRNDAERFMYSAASDASGHYSFEEVQPGAYHLGANTPGFSRADPTSRGAPAVSVAEEQTVADASLKLLPLATISGHVYDEDGEPVMGASVYVLTPNPLTSANSLLRMSGGSTNDLGEYRILEVNPQRCYLLAVPASMRAYNSSTQLASNGTTLNSLFYPDVKNQTEAKSLHLRPGVELTNMDFHLRRVPAFHVRGKIAGLEDGQAGRNIMLVLRSAESGDFHQVFVPVAKNSFEAGGLVPGNYILLGQSRAREPRFVRQAVTVGDRDAENIELTLMPGQDLAGEVTLEGTTPATWPKISIQLRSEETLFDEVDPAFVSNGSFAFHNLAPARYLVTINPVPGRYLKSMRFGDRDVLGQAIDLTQGGGKLEIVYGDDPAQVTGTVQTSNGTAAPGAWVTLVSRSLVRAPLNTFADATGNFKIADVAPGDYRVYAWETSDQSVTSAPDFQQALESKSAAVSLGANAQQSVQVNLITADDVEQAQSRLR